jgi:hypothetical protein
MIAPLSLSMGPAEWLLLRYRRQAHLLLHKTVSISAFAAGARRALMASVAWYLGVLGALTAVADLLLAPVTPPAPDPPALRGSGPPALTAPLAVHAYPPAPAAWLLLHAAYLALGGAIYTGLVLQACGRPAAPLCLGVLALTAEAAATWAGSPAWDAAALPAIQAGCYGLLLAAVGAAALTALSNVATHT